MIKKMSGKLAILLALVLVVSLLAVPVSAAESDAVIEFKSGGIDFEDGDAKHTPPEFDFGIHKITGDGSLEHEIKTMTKPTATADAEGLRGGYVNGFLAITDNRGTREGWAISLSLGNFSDGTATVMDGTKVTVNISGMKGGDADQEPLDLATNVELIAGDGTEHTIINAKPDAAGDNAGAGVWRTLTGDKGASGTETSMTAKINVLAGRAHSGSSTAKMNWKLIDAI